MIPDFALTFILVSGALVCRLYQSLINDWQVAAKVSLGVELSLVNFMAIVTLIASVFSIIFCRPVSALYCWSGLDEQGRSLAISMMKVSPLIHSCLRSRR